MTETNNTTTSTAAARTERTSTGIVGCDEILNGGLVPGRTTLVRGPPGAGKTLFGLHYLTAGITTGETALFINYGEPDQYIRDDASAFGFDTDAIEFLDLRPDLEAFTDDESYDVFPTVEVEGPSIAEKIMNAVESVNPDRIFIDPMTQFRYLIDDPYQFRKRVMALFRYLEGRDVVFTSQDTQAAPDDDLQFISDAVITLGSTGDHRTISVSKFRGSSFQHGKHTVRITDDGLVVSPVLLDHGEEQDVPLESISSGVPELDELLHGGIESGTLLHVQN